MSLCTSQLASLEQGKRTQARQGFGWWSLVGLALLTPQVAHGAGSHMNCDRDGWQVVDIQTSSLGTHPPTVSQTLTPTWNAAGGNPIGYLSMTDPGPQAFFFSAPAKFLGDQSAKLGGMLSYDLRSSGTGTTLTEAVLLVGTGMTLHGSLSAVVTPAWQRVEIPLLGASFTVNSATGPVATDSQLLTVLTNLQALYVFGDWVTGFDTSSLDNVCMEPSSRFDADRDGWSAVDIQASTLDTHPPTVNQTLTPTWNAAGGNPTGHISQVDPGPQACFFSAPAKFLGDQTAVFGGALSFDLMSSGTGTTVTDAVLLVGTTMTLHGSLSAPVTTAWQTTQIPLIGSSFTVNSDIGPVATDAELLAVLTNVQALYILADWVTGFDTGHLDNVTYHCDEDGPCPPPEPLSVRVSGADWFHDAFPFNDDPDLPGLVTFDTTSAMVKTGRNTAQVTGDTFRLDIPGDTLIACSCLDRVDLVFRIKPGPGNYRSPGVRASGLRAVPTSSTGIDYTSPGSNFWANYLADGGPVGGSGNQHAANNLLGTNGGRDWSEHAWNSARMDTAERNLWAIQGRGYNSEIVPCRWASMYHEEDPKFVTLGIAKDRCFLVTPTGTFTEQDITCDINQTDGWPYPAGYTDEDGGGSLALGQTYEFTKILPDGQFTPGTHVQYFIRGQMGGFPFTASMTPDTNLVYPQPDEVLNSDSDCTDTGGEGGFDGHRWQQFGVLPDRWKHVGYGGLGMACMLYVDLDDGHGDERAWVTAADQIGATHPPRYGAHNGWHVTKPSEDPNDPANFVYAHGGQPGTTWDMYGVRGVDDPMNGYAGSLGSRLCATAAGSAAGKEARIGPTEQMLWTYYRMLYVTTGRFDTGILGPLVDRSQDDVQMFMAFRDRSIGGVPRGGLFEGGSFAESEDLAGGTHLTWLNLGLGAELRNVSYPTFNPIACSDVLCTTAVNSPPPIYGVDNVQLPENDLLERYTPAATAYEVSYFSPLPPPPIDPNSPYVASTGILPFATTYWTGQLDAWDVQDLDGRFCPGSGLGRAAYLYDVFTNVFGAICQIAGSPVLTTDVGETERLARGTLRLVSNPARQGIASVELALERGSEVSVSVVDLAGRRIRTLSDGWLGAGTHSLRWDGRDDHGNSVRSGLYFVRGVFADDTPPITRSLVWLR